MNFDAIKDLLYRLADDELIIGHRMSEWTGIGPFLEEDIAFSSMAQDEVGHAQAYFIMLHELCGEPEPDILAFSRRAEQVRCCQLVEQPIGEYAFSLVRHVLYDMAEGIRLADLSNSSFRPLSELCKKLAREEKYHQLHAQTMLRQLGAATEESNRRLQEAVNTAYPMAFGLFEPTAYDEALADEGIQSREAELEAEWVRQVNQLLTASGLQVPVVADKTAWYGGRKGQHTTHLQPMLNEMTEVFVIDPAASW